jgi:hypothetical protein
VPVVVLKAVMSVVGIGRGLARVVERRERERMVRNAGWDEGSLWKVWGEERRTEWIERKGDVKQKLDEKRWVMRDRARELLGLRACWRWRRGWTYWRSSSLGEVWEFNKAPIDLRLWKKEQAVQVAIAVVVE